MIIDGTRLKDDRGRTLMLRGVNLGGSSKVPFTPDGATHLRDGFYEHRDVSFVGRPFPVEEADEHFERLRAWGFTFLRFLVTWEAIEHAGPGIYDEVYLEYVREIVEKAGEHGIDLYVDPHQDVWGRLCGGDGAPGWTLETVGMDPTRFPETGAAIIHFIHGEPFSHMCWPTNNTKLAAATMFTLFFGGSSFAPKTEVHGEPVQEFLQRHYIGALKQVAHRLSGLPNVVGYGTMNEPSAGYIGQGDVRSWDATVKLHLRQSPTPFEGMVLGAGYPRKVGIYAWRWAGFRRVGQQVVNPEELRVWEEGCDPIWRANGVWDVDAQGDPFAARPGHFGQLGGRAVDFANDYFRPFANRYARELRSVDPNSIIFVEGVPNDTPPRWGRDDAPNIVHAPHWYDGLTMLYKRFIPHVGADPRRGRFVIGRKRSQRSRAEQLAYLRGWSAQEMGGVPTLLGEFGLPLDLQGGRAYRTGDFSHQIEALDATYQALDANLLSGTLWNYTADNGNRWGDQWNNEDYSIFSRDQQTDPRDINSGGRALDAVVRPYPAKTSGEPLRVHFDVRSGAFEFEFRDDPTVSAPTELFVPNCQYPDGYVVEVSDGDYELDAKKQTLTYRPSPHRQRHTVRLRRRTNT